MKLLLTGACHPFTLVLSNILKEKHDLRLTNNFQIETDCAFITSELSHNEETDDLLQNVDILICLPYTQQTTDHETEWIDVTTRRQYNLLLAAAAANVSEVIIISTLDLMIPYDKDMTVTEDWKPLPSTNPQVLGAHLTEFVAREFAHSNALNVTILRLGHLIKEGEIANKEYDPMWLEESDAAEAISKLVDKADSGISAEIPYRVLHLQSVSKLSRFSSKRICNLLEFVPLQTFASHQ